MATNKAIIYVLDMESSLTEPLVRRIFDMGQYVIFRRWDMQIDAQAELDTYKDNIRGFVISGSGKNINSQKTPPPTVPAAFIAAGIPTLAICYGMQYLAHFLGVPIIRCWDEEDPEKRTKKAAKADKGEQGPVFFKRSPDAEDCPLFTGLGSEFPVWMKHNWMLSETPEGWTLLGSTEKCPVAAISSGNRYALQFHPEPGNSLFGKIIINNFLERVCGLETPYY